MSSNLLDSELQYFLKVARAKTFLAASESLGLSQPALSRAMDRLEGKLGFKVFERSRTGVELTEQGEKLLFGIKDFGEGLNSLIENIRDHSKEVSGEVRISAHVSILQDYLIPIFPQLVEIFPKVRFHLESKNSRHVVDDLLSGRTDIGLVINPIEYSTLIMKTLTSTKAAFYSETKDVERYFLNPQMIDLNRFLKVIKKSFLDENSLFFVDDYDLIAQLVKSGHGCGLIPHHVANRFGLHESHELSQQFKVNHQLKVVISELSPSEKKKQIFRQIETLIKSRT